MLSRTEKRSSHRQSRSQHPALRSLRSLSQAEELIRSVARAQPLSGDSRVALLLSQAQIALTDAARNIFSNAEPRPRSIA